LKLKQFIPQNPQTHAEIEYDYQGKNTKPFSAFQRDQREIEIKTLYPAETADSRRN
jgi:hypothetical protein